MLMTTSAPDRLLETIRSRAIDVRFPSLAPAEIREILIRRGFDEERRRWALRSAAAARRARWRRSTKKRIAAVAGRGVVLFAAAGGDAPEQTGRRAKRSQRDLRSSRRWRAIGSRSAWPVRASASGARLRYAAARSRADESRAAVAMLASLDEAQRIARSNVPPSLVGEMVRMRYQGRVNAMSSYCLANGRAR